MAGKDNTQFEELDLDNLDEPQEEPQEEPKRVLQSGAEIDEPEFVYEDEESEEPEETKAKAEKPEEKKPRKSRAQTRIRKLAQERNELQEQLERERRARFEMEERMRESTARSTVSRRKLVADRLKDLQEDQANALEQGDYKKHAELSQQVADTNLQLRVLDYEAQNIPRQRRQYQPMPRPAPEIPDAAQDWAEDNSWFVQPRSQDDAIKRQAALVLSNTMIAEGKDPSSEEFYQELDSALQARFGGQAPQENTQEPREEAPVRHQRPVIAGTGRQGVTRRSSKRTRRLTPQDREVIESLGITPQDYIKQLDAQEESGGGWTEIE